MKKFIFLLLLVLAFICSSFSVNASTHDLVLSNGKTVYYKNTDIAVQIPDTYEMQDQYFRGAWVTPLAGSIPSFSTEAKYKAEIQEMLDILEYYNCNAVIFHVRIMNDALYPSELNPRSGYLNTSLDMLPYVIEECHKRGIEFHAWMNPYRVTASGGNVDKIASNYKQKAPKNPASDAANLLSNSSGGVILNPALPNVRQFIIDTVIEVMENYDIDAIHFDDYFYITGVEDDSFYQASNPNNLSKSDWRREQVDIFIKDLHDAMKEFNEENDKYVQLGISPTGIYRNGNGEVTYDENGNAISSGSATGGQEHYESYLFSDTLKWVNEEWIDYITPQSYWAFSHTIAGYADVMSWWNKVVKYKNVNLYSGMGIYMSENPGSNYSWGFDSNESVNQILYATTLENVRGTVFYSYNYLEYAYKGNVDSLYGQGLTRIKNEIFTNKAIIPEIRTLDCEVNKIDTVECDIKDGKTTISFNKVKNAKFYVVYRSENDLTYAPEEVYDIFGSKDDVIKFVDQTDGKKYNYGIRVLAMNNALSDPIECKSKLNVVFKDLDGNVLSKQDVVYGQSAIAPTAPKKDGVEFVGWSRDFSSVTEDLVITPKYTDSKYYVTFYSKNGDVLKVDEVNYGESATAPDASYPGFVFLEWDKDFSKVVYDMDVYPTYDIKYCNVVILDYDGTELLSYSIKYGLQGYFPVQPERDGYNFIGWSDDLAVVTDDITVTAQYAIKTVKVTVISDYDGSIIATLDVPMYSDAELPTPPEYYGFRFAGWRGLYENLRFDSTVRALYEEICYTITFVGLNDEVIEEMEYFANDGEYYPEVPVIEGYTFVGWDTDITKLPTDNDVITIKALYDKNEVSIKFVGFDGVVLKEYNLTNKDELETVEVPETPVIEGYTFTGWDKEYENVWDDQVYTALYEMVTFTVKFIGINDEIVKEEIVGYGKDVVLPEAPVVEGYEFVGFSSEGKNITSDLVITLNYEAKKLTVKFIGYNDEILSEVEVEYGKDVTLPTAPVVEGYEFVSFSDDGKNITSDLEIKLNYEVKKFTVKFIGHNNEVISEVEVEYGKDATLPTVPEVEGYKFKDFSHDGKNITEDLTITLNYEVLGNASSCNSGSLIKLMFTLFTVFAFAYIFKKR